MIVLGVDPGTEITGYGLLESDGTRHTCMECGVIRMPARMPLPSRLHKLAERLRQILTDHAIDAVAVEDIFFAVNVRSALRLAHARGVVLLCAAERQTPIFEYSPLEVKKAVSGYGRAEKSQVQEMVRILLRMASPPTPVDASDALAVAICHAQMQSVRQAIQRAGVSRDVIRKNKSLSLIAPAGSCS